MKYSEVRSLIKATAELRQNIYARLTGETVREISNNVAVRWLERDREVLLFEKELDVEDLILEVVKILEPYLALCLPDEATDNIGPEYSYYSLLTESEWRIFFDIVSSRVASGYQLKILSCEIKGEEIVYENYFGGEVWDSAALKISYDSCEGMGEVSIGLYRSMNYDF